MLDASASPDALHDHGEAGDTSSSADERAVVGWRINADADYGTLNTFTRGKIDLREVRRNWEDILRVVASIYTGTVRAYDMVTILQRDGHPTAIGEAIAAYGRIFKSLHILAYIDVDETYRRDIKHIRNLQEGRHSLARKICHGKKGELYHRYQRGLENQLGVLGLVLNCVVLWNTVYLDAAVQQLRAQGYPLRGEDMARLSPFVSKHLCVHGAYSFALPDLPLRCDPRAARPRRGRRRRRRHVTYRGVPSGQCSRQCSPVLPGGAGCRGPDILGCCVVELVTIQDSTPIGSDG
ncbi:transposase [Planotetraspora sp. A-T 1434]|uniref:transposase n=1 Tax=Planotetraspora sp. A-T 1434 TaxID=2979219 RepID=UPI0021BFD38D|nr:transposase [Planotetraspora sp. A-T 1434]MCT9929953.1 transposase [Planotetraspora sp. A-T 1434]